MAAVHGKTATEVTKGMYQVISSGAAAGAASVVILNQALTLAKVGMTDTETAVRGLMAVMNSYGYNTSEAARVSNILFLTVKNGMMRFEGLAAVIGRVAPIAAAAKVPFDQLSAAIAAVSLSGLSVDESVTSLRALLNTLISPSEEAVRVAKELAIEWNAAGLEAQGLVPLLRQMQRATGGNIVTMSQLIPNIRAMPAALSLAGKGGEKYVKILVEMREKATTLGESLAKLERSVAIQTERMGTAFTEMGRKFGEVIVKITQGTGLVRTLTDAAARLGYVFGQMPSGETLTWLDGLRMRLAQAGTAVEQFIVLAEAIQKAGGFKALREGGRGGGIGVAPSVPGPKLTFAEVQQLRRYYDLLKRTADLELAEDMKDLAEQAKKAGDEAGKAGAKIWEAGYKYIADFVKEYGGAMTDIKKYEALRAVGKEGVQAVDALASVVEERLKRTALSPFNDEVQRLTTLLTSPKTTLTVAQWTTGIQKFGGALKESVTAQTLSMQMELRRNADAVADAQERATAATDAHGKAYDEFTAASARLREVRDELRAIQDEQRGAARGAAERRRGREFERIDEQVAKKRITRQAADRKKLAMLAAAWDKQTRERLLAPQRAIETGRLTREQQQAARRRMLEAAREMRPMGEEAWRLSGRGKGWERRLRALDKVEARQLAEMGKLQAQKWQDQKDAVDEAADKVDKLWSGAKKAVDGYLAALDQASAKMAALAQPNKLDLDYSAITAAVAEANKLRAALGLGAVAGPAKPKSKIVPMTPGVGASMKALAPFLGLTPPGAPGLPKAPPVVPPTPPGAVQIPQRQSAAYQAQLAQQRALQAQTPGTPEYIARQITERRRQEELDRRARELAAQADRTGGWTGPKPEEQVKKTSDAAKDASRELTTLTGKTDTHSGAVDSDTDALRDHAAALRDAASAASRLASAAGSNGGGKDGDDRSVMNAAAPTWYSSAYMESVVNTVERLMGKVGGKTAGGDGIDLFPEFQVNVDARQQVSMKDYVGGTQRYERFQRRALANQPETL